MLLITLTAFLTLQLPAMVKAVTTDFNTRQCEPIRIDMCRGIGYNETSMPNIVGHEVQSEVEFTLQTFAPLIEYVCSTQLKLFLCTAYVPMCTSKVPVPIGPCRSLCESVRSRCHPVLQGFGFPWPPALNCSRFPKENNHETMCMEGPGEAHLPIQENDMYYGVPPPKTPQVPLLECPSTSKSHLYVKLQRSGRCAPLCEADILFGQHEKHLAEVWTEVWCYALLGLSVLATLCLIFGDDTKNSSKWSCVLTPLVWCHDMVAVGWTVRFVSGRIATACGYDPQIPNVSLLLVDGLSNASCAATFLLRYYFGMAACVWWSILCLGWHREIRRNSPDNQGQISLNTSCVANTQGAGQNKISTGKSSNRDIDVTKSNLARFAAWGLPAFQTAAVIVARLVDADELLGACFVGNQSDKGLQIFVATPLFCYWIFGSMNLISGYLVHRRNKEIFRNSPPSFNLQCQMQQKSTFAGIGTFLFIYCAPYALLLLAVIYEFANIDVWLNMPPYIAAIEGNSTPLWPFLTRAFMEIMMGIICFAWVLGPKISTMYKRQLTPHCVIKQPTIQTPAPVTHPVGQSSRSSNVSYSTVSYQTVRYAAVHGSHQHPSSMVSMNRTSNYSLNRSKKPTPEHHYSNYNNYKHKHKFNRRGDETIV